MGGVRKIQFENGYYYHVYNRGVDKRKIFLEDFDYIRLLEGLRDFNNVEMVGSLYLKRMREKSKKQELRSATPKKPLVRILCHCLMPNHYHLLLEQLEESGITEFMRRLGTGYTNYFNLRYERTGRLFEGAFKAKLIKQQIQLEHVLRYIHLNPLDTSEPEWRNHGIKDFEKAEKFLRNYRWSSHLAYVSDRPSEIIDKGIFNELFEDKKEYQDFLKGWAAEDMSYLEGSTLE